MQHAGATAPGTNGGLLMNQNGYLELVDPDTLDRDILFSPYADYIGDYGISPNGQIVVQEYFYYDYFSGSYIDAGILLSSVDHSQQFLLSTEHGYQFSFSPDSSMIAYSYYDNDSSKNALHILDLSTMSTFELDKGLNNHPVWSPDGNRIAYPKNGNIYTYNVNTSVASLLTNDGYGGLPLDWSPDGSKLFIARDSKLYLVNSSNGQVQDFDPTNKYSYINGAAFSPDGTQIAFTTWSGGGPNHLYVVDGFTSTATTREISTVDLRGGVHWQTIPEASDAYRFWSPDHQHHFFTTNYLEALNVMINYPDNIWSYEGVAFQQSTNTTCALDETPVYRFWSDKLTGHFFTANESEKNYVMSHYPSNVWRYEGQAFCSLSSETPGAKPVYRFWSDLIQSHFYTADPAEKDFILSHYPTSTWRYEGIGYYAL